MIASKNIILFDDDHWESMLPLSYTRPVADMRVGILTIAEKWEKYLAGNVHHITKDHLSDKYNIEIQEDNLFICGRLIPNERMISLIKDLKMNQALLYKDHLIASRLDFKQCRRIINNEPFDHLDGTDISSKEDWVELIERPFHLFERNGDEIKRDYQLLTKDKTSVDLPNHVNHRGKHPVFIEAGVEIGFATFDTTKGPIYLAKNSKVLDGAIIQGPMALGENSVVKLGAKIYADCSFGPHCKIGGELSNVIFHSYSSKGHDGFLGNSVVGQWCNFGADTNTSNLKNNYAPVKLWDYREEKFANSGLQFCGLIMGDHSKCGINTMFNTGTVIGVSCNIFGSGFPRNFVPSFAWGGTQGYKTYKLEKCFETAKLVLARRNQKLNQEDQNILEEIFNYSQKYRSWEVE